jgi:hypothetical protein
MDLQILRTHEDRVKNLLDPLPRIEQLIALNYLRRVISLSIDVTDREIEKEYRKEMKETRAQ